MPWCTACDRFLSPSTVLVDGTCPSCARPVDAGGAHLLVTDLSGAVVPPDSGIEQDPEDLEEPPDPLPWHLWLMLGALALYLGYRAFQGIEWLVGI